MRVLLDTGPLVALLNRRDAHHKWTAARAASLARPLYTCEAVITEAHFLLGKVYGGSERLNEFLATGRLDFSFRLADHVVRVGELMSRYADVPMSFADACLVCMAEQEASTVFSLDSDFVIYRQRNGRPVQAILP